MASSRKSKSDLEERVADALCPVVPPNSSILLGLSGGLDSVVLLHVLHGLAPRFGWQLSALHVHHGISPNADAWAEFCLQLCQRYAVRCVVERVSVAALRGAHGVEAAARKLRYEAYSRQHADFIALAHHADDQTETLLLQLLRGAGVRGAAAMPLVSAGNTRLLRPLLEVSRRELLSYAQRNGLQWVEDESNQDDAYARNFLRHRIFPVLEERYPAYRATLARSSRHFAEASGLLDDLARIDMPDWRPGMPLSVDLLARLSPERARNLLRYALYAHGMPMPQEAQLEEAMQQLFHARADAAVCVEFGMCQLRRYRHQAYVMEALPAFDPAFALAWAGEPVLYWPPLNCRLVFRQVQGQGIALHSLQRPVALRLRCGHETIRLHPRGASRSLKNFYQEQEVPPWQRERFPLLYCGEKLASVVGHAVAADFQARDNEPGLLVEIEPTCDSRAKPC